ncbi:MAG TPA: class I SAM-dependent methyltransferase [Chloroflexota bacterium]|nr:class I SAM-dependent methyltransferase [Chloroflexota bacterium]
MPGVESRLTDPAAVVPMEQAAIQRYQRDHPVLTDERSRSEKAARILAVLREIAGRDTQGLIGLDLGCGGGIIAARLAPHFRWMFACDLDPDGVRFARSKFPRPNLTYFVADATEIPMADGSCDVVICTHVYEHVASAERLVAEIRRVLKHGGLCFFSGPNRLAPYEPHLHTFFLHWFPRWFTNAILRLIRRPQYEELPRGPWSLKRLLQIHGFEIRDVSEELVRQPDRFHATSEPGIQLARFVPPFLLRPILRLFIPSFNLLLTRK